MNEFKPFKRSTKIVAYPGRPKNHALELARLGRSVQKICVRLVGGRVLLTRS